ncbi:MAG: hypothetical protein GY870_20830 [archaeon]|nr:hypothetical protein [archaeon]
MANLLLQLLIFGCFFVLIVVLFLEKKDYLTYSILLIIIAGIITAFFIPETAHLEFYIDSIDWEVIFFLIGMFTIVEILKEKLIFQEISRRIVKNYEKDLRKMFYILCIVSTITAAFLEDLSVAIIFGPIIVLACRDIKINPTPYLLGTTICINLASTLTPFGSAENILIVNSLNLEFIWFLQWLSIYFIISTIITLVLLDQFMLKKYLNVKWNEFCEDDDKEYNQKTEIEDFQVIELTEIKVDNKTFYKNIICLVIFIILLIFIPTLYLPCIISAIMFVFVNPVVDKNGEKQPRISHYLSKVDYKLIYFFMCLFILVNFMRVNGSISYIEDFIMSMSFESEFILCIIILVLTSIFSGFMDNAPVTILFLPIVELLILTPGFNSAPIIIAFILGINLGGNFLPQGSACDMMTLEISRKFCVNDLTYKKLFKVGGLFALIHIFIGIIYLAVLIFWI